MKAIYSAFKLILAIVMMVFGVFLVFSPFLEIYDFVHGYYLRFLEQFSAEAPVREIAAGTIAIIGLIIGSPMVLRVLRLLRVLPRKKKRAISFTGMHGPVSIQLDHVESTLERVAMKLPEVRRATIKLEPTDSPGRASVTATVELLKNADDDARMVTARVQHYIKVHTKKILGLNDVDVRLDVTRIIMKMKTVKPQTLLIEGPLAAAAGVDTLEAASSADVDEEMAAESKNEAVGAAVAESGDELQLER